MKISAALTYSEKLKLPQWHAFRDKFIYSRRQPEGEKWCDDCGHQTDAPLHVHHKRYLDGREPWEYEYDDLRLVCETCHDRIHAVEQRMRRLCLTLRPHECGAAEDLLEELEKASRAGSIAQAFAHAKNAVRGLFWRGVAA